MTVNWAMLGVAGPRSVASSARLATILRRRIGATTSSHAAATSRGALGVPFRPAPVPHSAVVIQGAPVGGARGGQTE